MKILILDSLENALLERLLADNVIYRPDLLRKNREALVGAMIASDVDAIISSADFPLTLVHEWSATRAAQTYWVHITGDSTESSSQSTAHTRKPASGKQLAILDVQGVTGDAAYIAAFQQLEQEFTRRNAPMPSSVASTGKNGKEQVLLTGAGLVNLITAHTLQSAGYRVKLVDAGPDPRAAADWTAYGCSHGGDDARMFTLSEMDNYNDREVSTTMNSLFQRNVTEAGWNVHWKGTLSNDEQRWIKEFESIPTWLADRYNEDIFAFNRESQPLWEQWIAQDPSLFDESLFREGILRIYSDPAQYASAVKRQNRIGATQYLLTSEEVASKHPALADAVKGNHIAGGVHAVGFTVNAHKFIYRLLDRLTAGGAEFEWNQRAHNILFDANRNIKGIRTQSKVLEADHYVISPGAYGASLLAGTRSNGKIHGVLGAWLRLPNTEPELTHSLKLARKGHITEDANITVATDENGAPIMIIGSGYGHTGIDPRNIDQALLHQIYQGLVDTAEKYFPKAYKAAVAAGNIEASFKYCVRPWTATSLGVFEILGVQGGGKGIITGGHNTGGFAQSPAIAQAVLAAVAGREHAMHYAYDPERASRFLSAVSPIRDREPRVEPLEIG